MTGLGLNVDASGRHDAAWVVSAGADAVRIVLTYQHNIRKRLREYQTAGLFVLGVYARESRDGLGADADALAYYARQYGDLLNAVQVGNEADLDSPSSWTMSPEELTKLGWTARAAMPSMTLVCAGMASGQPDWLAAVGLGWANAVAVHPYAKDATEGNDLPDAWELVEAYWHYGLPIWVTEWGWWGDEARGEYETRDMVTWALCGAMVERFFYFCADDLMVPPFGLYRADGSPKPAALAFREVAGRTDPVTPSPPPDPGWVGDGLQAELDRLGWSATSDEHDETLRLVRAGDDLVVWSGDGALAYRRA